MSKKYTLFVCGTPSQRGGFKHKVLEGEKLLSSPSKYLDKYNAESMSGGSTYIVQQLKLEDKAYSLLIEYREIVPMGQKTSQGSYIAVGVLTQEPIDVNDSILFYQMLSEVHAHLSAYRDANNAFTSTFDLNRYIYRPKKMSLDIAYLIDTFCRASSKREELFKPMGKVTYNEAKYVDNMITHKHFHYLSDSSEKIKKIQELDEKLNRKESEHNDTLISIEMLKKSYRAKELEHDKLRSRYEEKRELVHSLKSQNIELSKERDAEPVFLNSDVEVEKTKFELPFDAKYLLWGLLFIAVVNILF